MAQIDIDKFVISLRRCFGEYKGIATTLDRCLFSQGLKYVDTPTGGRLERVDQPTMLENQSKNPKSLKERIGCEADCTIKQEWSEYDEKMLLELSQCCDLNKTQVQWLLSLKDRVQPQPEQGWSEENERIKKWLICLLNEMQYHHCDDDREMGNKALAWLEKQSQVKEPTISQYEEDERIRETIIKILLCFDHYEGVTGKSMIAWINKHRSKPAEWSEEDEEIANKGVLILKSCAAGFPTDEKFANEFEIWLKSLKERYTWKPSNEQMEALLYEVNAWDEDSVNGQNLKSLYQGLKKLLREE